MNRFNDALLIQSACNLPGVARAVVRMCDQVLAEDGNVREDAAVRLAVFQLAYLCNSGDSMPLDEYARLTKICEERSKEAA